MTLQSIQGEFSDSARQSARERKSRKSSSVPFSLRLTEEEHALLKQNAGALSMAAYARLQLFADVDDRPKRRTKKTKKVYRPSNELKVIGYMLGGLGQSGLAANLDTLARSAEQGALPLEQETIEQLRDACATIQDMRRVLIAALGVKAR